ncbi:GNAT family N-acetyltransferase [Paraburkholderia sp.]|uniref:GNAT family N-acetyltransferase n=1 Tax=Paraburkholderia sp. TaxID=1926495 RepID=UPI0039E6504A
MYEIRAARTTDADCISHVIIRCLRETNAQDYPDEVIRRVGQNFSAAAVLALMARRTVFVATLEKRIVGTASLDGSVVRTVFVSPDLQHQGIGRLLMEQVEREARAAGVKVLAVPSSVTAGQFYSRLGFKPVREDYYGEERTIVMERNLAAP